MRSSLLVLVCVALTATSAFSQKPTPTPDDDVVRISTNLIQVDVSVTDRKGDPVTDLKPNEVEVYENGQRQTITNFSFISGLRQAASAVPSNVPGVSVPPVPLRPEQVHRTIALVVDDLALSMESTYYVRRALKKFVEEQMQPGDLVAIIRTGAGIGALQQFTSDKRMLYAAIDKVKWNPSGTGGVTAFAPIETDPNTAPTPDDNGDVPGATGGQSLESFRSTVFSIGTLGALKYVVGGMSALPGRKSVILFSDGFKLFEKDENGNQADSQVLDFLRVLTDTANRAAVTFYTVDPRGLQFTGFTAADKVGDTDPDAMNSARQERSDQLRDTQDGLRYLAEETGGFAIINTNDISGGVKKVLDDQSYYLIAYTPDADTFDPKKPKFNQLAVRVLRPGLKVRYRSGFFNVADKERVATAPDRRTPAQQLTDALTSPFTVSGIDLRLNALFGSDPKAGPFVRSLLHVNAANLHFTDQKDGTKRATIEVLAMAFGDNGQVTDELAKGYNLTIRPENYKNFVEHGFVYQFAFPVKKAGAYQYRVAVRDAIGGSVGSASQFIEVPDLKKKVLTLSSILIQNVSGEQWKNIESGAAVVGSSSATDTALRRIVGNSVLRYGYEIYNAKLDGAKQPHLNARLRIFRDGKLFFEGKDTPVDIAGQTDLEHIKAVGALAIGKTMQAGDYVLQIVVTDAIASQKRRIATQILGFEVTQ